MTDRSISPILLKVDIQHGYLVLLMSTPYDDACLKELIFLKLLLVVANLCNLQFFANKYLCAPF